MGKSPTSFSGQDEGEKWPTDGVGWAMNAKTSLTASVALMAMFGAWFQHHFARVKCERAFEEKCAQDALETFEGEGGLVLS